MLKATKHLGVYLDSRLNFSKHINEQVLKATKHLGVYLDSRINFPKHINEQC